VGCLTMSVGPVIVAVMTASITQALQLSADDAFLSKRMECNHLRLKVMDAAARILQNWWLLLPSSRRRSHSASRRMYGCVDKTELSRRLYVALAAFERFQEAIVPFAIQMIRDDQDPLPSPSVSTRRRCVSLFFCAASPSASVYTSARARALYLHPITHALARSRALCRFHARSLHTQE